MVTSNPSAEAVTAGHLAELRRGTVVLACLVHLRQPGYRYALLEALKTRGMAVDANTLYPLLRRLEKQGLLASKWNTDETRPRKFYTTSATGEDLARALNNDWIRLDAAVRDLTAGDADPRKGALP